LDIARPLTLRDFQHLFSLIFDNDVYVNGRFVMPVTSTTATMTGDSGTIPAYFYKYGRLVFMLIQSGSSRTIAFTTTGADITIGRVPTGLEPIATANLVEDLHTGNPRFGRNTKIETNGDIVVRPTIALPAGAWWDLHTMYFTAT
jgi:hypothetical protein